VNNFRSILTGCRAANPRNRVGRIYLKKKEKKEKFEGQECERDIFQKDLIIRRKNFYDKNINE